MVRLLERLLQLHPGDLSRGLLLFLYLFLIIASYVVGKITRDTLFLAEFDANLLPFLDIFIAASVGFVVAGYLWIGRRTNLRNLQVGSLIFFSLTWLALWWQAGQVSLFWLNAAIYLWVGVFGVLAPMQVWMLANYTLTTREAKRIFGLVAFGATSGFLFAGVYAGFSMKYLGTESLLIGMAIFQAVCAVLVVLIWQRKHTAEGDEPRSPSERKLRVGVLQGLRLVASTRYLQAISAVICVASFVTTFAHWQFRAVAQSHFGQDEAALGLFFSNFYSIAAALCVTTQLLLTSRVLRRFGLGFTLFVVPVALLFGTIGLLFFGTLTAAVLLRGSDQVLRYSIDKSSVELLYLPVTARIKLQVKAVIDTVIWRLGDGLASMTLALFVFTLGWSAQQVSWINLALIASWIVAAYIAYSSYVGTLQESIREHRLDAERMHAPMLDHSTTEILVRNLDSLDSADTKEVLYALGLFEMASRPATHPALRGFLQHASPAVRAKALALLTAARDRSVQLAVEKMLADSDLRVRTEAILYLAHITEIDPLERIQELGDFADYSVQASIIAFLARPGASQNLPSARVMLNVMINETGPEGYRSRLEAARLLSRLPADFSDELRRLLEEDDAEIIHHALQAARIQGHQKLLPDILERLRRRESAEETIECLAGFGDGAVGALRDSLRDTSFPLEARNDIATVLSRIGTPRAALALAECILNPDARIRFEVISGLNRLHTRNPEVPVDGRLIETVLGLELLGHYRTHQIRATMASGDSENEPIQDGLREAMKQEIERIFRLLSLLYPHHDFHSVYFALQSKDAQVHDNALELLDNVLKPEIRKVLVPALDSNVSLQEKAKIADRFVGAKIESRTDAAATLIHSDDPWLKSCGAYAIGAFGLHELRKELDGCLAHSDPLLREAARQAHLQLDGHN